MQSAVVGRFLILGSASIDLLRQSGESLAGRISYLQLTRLTPVEVAATRTARERLWSRAVNARSRRDTQRFGASARAGGHSAVGHPLWPALASFYRTSGGAEIDLVIEFGGGEVWAIEVKRSIAPKVSRGFHTACDDLKPDRALVVHAGDDRFPISKRAEGIGLLELAKELRRG